MARSVSKALVGLSVEVAERARTESEKASPRQIERWIDAGLLPRLTRRWPGGGGSESLYPPEMVELVMQAARAVSESSSFDEVALLLFVRGATMDEKRLRLAYAHRIDAVISALEQLGASSDPGDIGEALAVLFTKRTSELGKQWRRRLRARRDRLRRERLRREREERAGRLPPTFEEAPADREPVAGLLQSAIHNAVVVMLTGEPASADGMLEFFDASGVTAVARDHLPGESSPDSTLIPPALPSYFELLHLAELKRRMAGVSIEQLKLARADLLLFRSFAQAFAEFVRRVMNMPEAYGFTALAEVSDTALAYALPAMVWLRMELPNGVDTLNRLMDAKLEGFRAANRILDQLPIEFHAAFAPGIYRNQLTEADQRELTILLRELAVKYPTDMQLIATLENENTPVG